MRLSDLPGCWLVNLYGEVEPIKMNDTIHHVGMDAQMVYSKRIRRYVMAPKQPHPSFIIWPKECFHEF